MIEVTETAAEVLVPLLAADPTRKVLRLYVMGRSCSGVQYGLALDEKAGDGDSVERSRGVEVAIDALSASLTEAATIDYVNTAQGSGFIVRSPEVLESGGGCGGGCACGQRS